MVCIIQMKLLQLWQMAYLMEHTTKMVNFKQTFQKVELVLLLIGIPIGSGTLLTLY